MKILVTGSRRYSDQSRLDAVLDELEPSAIVHGGAPGADSLAGQWARRHSITELCYPADWGRYGKQGGPIRNRQMLLGEPDIELVVAFPLDGSVGTLHMLRIAKAVGIPTQTIATLPDR